MDRCHGIGQKNSVNVYRLITESTVEEKIVERQSVKLKWDQIVIQNRGCISKKFRMTKQDKLDIILHGANKIIKTGATITDYDIEEILRRGEERTIKEQKELDDQIKKQMEAFTGLKIETISVFNFQQEDYKEKR